MNTEHGGERDTRLAPVIPLFGGEQSTGEHTEAAAVAPDGEETWHATWVSEPTRGHSSAESSVRPRSESRGSRGGGAARGERRGAAHPGADGDDPSTGAVADPAEVARRAEEKLLRALRRRSLSLAEAHALLCEDGCDAGVADDIVQVFVERGYLDDSKLAEQLVHIGATRKRQGRGAIARTLSERGIPREQSGVALEPLGDDEAERAREFADKKARSMRDLPRDVAVRRLVGQLARRGFGSVALSVAKDALDAADEAF